MLRRALEHIRRRSVPFVALLFALGGGAMTAPALADTTIGQTGVTNANACNSPVTLADTNYVVPSGGGWITSFSYQSTLVLPSVPTEPLDFLVLRPAQGNYTVVGVTEATVRQDGGLQTFFAIVGGFIPVQGGDILGFSVPTDLPACARSISGGGLISGTAPSPPTVGDTFSQLGSDPTSDLNLSANLVVVPTIRECKFVGWTLFGFKSQGACFKFSRTH